MKLIGSVTSPYVRKVRIVMAEKKLDYQFVTEDVWSPHTGIHAANPLGKVPCLVMEGGEAVFDSRVIVEYLDTMTPVAKLIPPSGRERAEVRTWEALADGVVDREGVEGLAGRVGYTPRHLGRILTAELGAGPLALARRELVESFATNLHPGDVLFMPDPIYFGGTVKREVTSADIANDITISGGNARHIAERAAAAAHLVANARPGDRIVVMGARDDTLPLLAAEMLTQIDRRDKVS
jgi:hypothetical protein